MSLIRSKVVPLFLSFMVTPFACRSRSQNNGLKIDNGSFVLEAGSYMPGVLPLVNESGKNETFCTATAVSYTTIVTAAHCLDRKVGKSTSQKGISTGDRLCVRFPDKKITCTDQVYIPSAYFSEKTEARKFAYDLAIGIFPDKTFSYFHGLGVAAIPAAKAEVLMVGYSSLNLYSEDFEKRWGRNTGVANSVTQASSDIVSKRETGEKDTVSASPGDSGGPLFDTSCRLRGVASRVTGWDPKYSIHVALASKEAASFFTDVGKVFGAKYCEMGEGCEKVSAFVGPIRVDSPIKFPCKSPAEDRDPIIVQAISDLKAEREAAAKLPGPALFLCSDKQALSSRSASRGLCTEFSFVDTSDESKTCSFAMVSSDQEGLLTVSDAAEVDKRQQEASVQGTIGMDYAFYEFYRAASSKEAFENLKCKAKTLGQKAGCCGKVVCRSILGSKNGNLPTPDRVVDCSDLNAANAVLYAEYYDDYFRRLRPSIGPANGQFAQLPFDCSDVKALFLRSNEAICYDDTTLKANTNPPSSGALVGPAATRATSTCWRVKARTKTSQKVTCPALIVD